MRVLLVALALLASDVQAQEAQTADTSDVQRPNIVLVFVDDLGYGDVGAFGADLIATPHLDRMASEGAKLTSFFSSANICTPSRAGLMTGRYAIRMGLAEGVLFPDDETGLPPEEVTVAEALKEQGYVTAAIGKWHLGHLPLYLPTNHGFDTYYGIPYSNDMNNEGRGDPPIPLLRDTTVIEQPVDQATITERYTAEAIRFIEEHQDEPFFVYLAHTMPHVPLYASERFEGTSEAGLYGDVVETIDWGMGELFSTLDSLGLDEETIVLFTSDNGPWYEGSAGIYRDRKGSSWEGGHRVPFLARWPGRIPAGTTSGAITMNIDLFPTLAQLAGADVPQDRPIDGKDIWDVLQGSDESPHEVLYFFDNNEIAAVRAQDWKLVTRAFYRGGHPRFDREGGYYEPGLLFNLELDPEERYSYTRDSTDALNRMLKQLEQGRAELESLAVEETSAN